MRTTVELPDDLFRRLKVRAASSGMRLKELIAVYVEQGLAEGTAPRQEGRSRPPIAVRATGTPIPARTQAEAFALLELEEREADAERD